MATNIATTVRTAIAALLTADSAARTLCGRTSKLVVRWNALADAARPVYALLLVSNTPTGGLGDRRAFVAQLSAIAEGDTGLTTAEALAQRARELLTPQALEGQGLTVVDMERPSERSADESDDPVPGYARVDLDFPFVVTAP